MGRLQVLAPMPDLGRGGGGEGVPATRASAPAVSTGQWMPGVARLDLAVVEGLAPA